MLLHRARGADEPLFEPSRTIELHGQTVSYVEAGSGPVLVLLHGITSSSRTWGAVLPLLAEQHTVIAPDLLGHGASGKPRGDYSLGAYASSIRDLLIALGHERATVLGHSLGGGVALQFAYQFPERLERLILVSSGGLGREVSILLRAATLPGAEYVLPVISGRPVREATTTALRALGKLGIRPNADGVGIGEGFGSLGDVEARRAFLHTARSIIEPSGQRVSAADRLYLAAWLPTLIVWGERDRMIPVAHGRAAAAAMPESRLEVFEEAGHFPFNDDPGRFASVVSDFMATTEAPPFDAERLRELLRPR
ncbi:alpha/beta fold hydrolase [Solirubrobacter phytolaccae]|uniref:Alpha/beta fold hydrolase n=1 Tax=Solirubrobacter phytolaccae TaxID=1404360 RepID=A0A9X3NGJ7_9ACTN|nr:alpha/beta fold hydrolase [Solirubrobacter phytolaccae]MDA0183656.1 alpha/beta fold hydrolase [Solirubrobacter phytolaccae]